MVIPKDGFNSGINRQTNGHITTNGLYVDDSLQSHNRYIQVAGNTATTDVEPMGWAEAEGVYAVRFKVIPGAAGTPGAIGDRVKVVFDASPVGDLTDVSQANTWLTTATVSPSTDVEYFELICGGLYDGTTEAAAVDAWSVWFRFSSPLRRADFLAMDGDNSFHVFAEVA